MPGILCRFRARVSKSVFSGTAVSDCVAASTDASSPRAGHCSGRTRSGKSERGALSAPVERKTGVGHELVRSAVYGVQAFLPHIKAHGEGGHIVNTASLAGDRIRRCVLAPLVGLSQVSGRERCAGADFGEGRARSRDRHRYCLSRRQLFFHDVNERCCCDDRPEIL